MEAVLDYIKFHYDGVQGAEDIVAAANAYGELGEQNGVVVSFKEIRGSEAANTAVQPLQTNPRTLTSTASVIVTIDPKKAQSTLTIAHEGSHIIDAKSVAADQTKQLHGGKPSGASTETQYQREFKAYKNVQDAASRSIGQTVNVQTSEGDVQLGAAVPLNQLTTNINTVLERNYTAVDDKNKPLGPLTPANQGRCIVPCK